MTLTPASSDRSSMTFCEGARRMLPLGVLLAALGCSGGLSCGEGCSSDYVYGTTAVSVPNGVRGVDDGVRMRLSQSGLDFLEANLRQILASQLGEANGQFRFNLPPGQISGNRVEYGRASVEPFEEHPTTVIVDAEALGNNLTFQFDDAGNGLRIRAEDIPIGVDMRLFSDFDLGNAACHLRGSSPDYGGAPYITGLTIEAVVLPRVGRGAECDNPAVNSECLKIDVNVIAVDLDPRGNLGGEDLDLFTPPSCSPPCQTQFGSPSCSNYQGDGVGFCSEQCSDQNVFESPGFECSGVCGVSGFFVDLALEFVGAIEPLVQSFLDEALERAIRSALDGVDGAPIAASGRFDIATAAAGILPESALDLGYEIKPTGNAFDVNSPAGGNLGMDLILKSGFEAAPPLDENDLGGVPHPCVRPIEGVEFADLYGDGVNGEFQADDADPLSGSFNGANYHLGASLAKPALNQMMFALYNTGSLCIEISSDAIHTLAGGQFDLSAATLDLLTQGKLKQFADPNAPAIIALSPSQPPVIRYGAGTVDEGHIIIEWPDVEVSFYVLMFERFSRIFAVSADISMELAVFNDPATETLQISVVNGPNIDNFVQNYNELLPGVDFQEVLESLIGVAFDAALGDEGLQFEYDLGNALTDALGVPIFIDFQGIETLPANDREFLNVYLSMTDTAPQPQTVSPSRVRLAHEPGVLRMAEAEDVRNPGRASIPTGRVAIDVDSTDGSWDREYFARVDFGAWRGPMLANNGTITVRDPKLSLAGEHSIVVRSRQIGNPNSLEDAGDPVVIHVDPLPPTVEIVRVVDDGDGNALIAARGADNVTRSDGLMYSWQLDDLAPGEFGAASVLDLDDVDATRVSVRAMDLAGNISKPFAIDARVERERLKDEREAADSTRMGCSSARSESGAVVLGLLLVLPLLRRRRRAG